MTANEDWYIKGKNKLPNSATGPIINKLKVMAFFKALSFLFLPIKKYIIPNDNPMNKVHMNVKIVLSVYPDSILKIEYAKYLPII